jgi:sulfate-transporting ATPase
MQEVIRFALLGFGVGALYSLASQGLVLIYRGSGVLNFAHGAVGMVGAYVAWEMDVKQNLPWIIAFVIGVAVSAAVGVLTHLFIMRPLKAASPLARVVVTLGVLVTLQSIAVLRYGSDVVFWTSALPTDTLNLFGDVVISVDRLILFGVAAVMSVSLWALYKYTRFGIGTGAVAENQRAAASLGWSPDVIATANWALGSAMAGIAAILIAPIVTLQVSVMTNLVLAAMAAALVARFTSFPIAFAAGMIIGIVQTELNRYVTQPGLGNSVPFIVVIVVLVLRGQALPLRDFFLQRLPRVGSGQIKVPQMLIGIAILVFLLAVLTDAWKDAITVTLCMAVVLMSIVVLTGYTGQLSLAQYALAGFGAWVCGRLCAAAGFPFWLGLIVGTIATVPLGVLFALPAVRTRGINLAIVTLGLGTAVEYMLFNNDAYTGGFAGTVVKDPTVFGFEVSAISHPVRYGILALVCFVAVAIAVANVRRGRSGRRLIAVRTNERAAAALGISVPSAKLYAFGLSAGIAGLGGILLAFRTDSITFTTFSSLVSINTVGWTMIGGIGYLMGPWFGGTFAPGAFGTQLGNEIFTGIAKYVPLIGGLSLILIVLQNQDGIAPQLGGQLRWLGRKILSLGGRKDTAPKKIELPPATQERVAEATLEVRGLTVRYGGVTAVEGVDTIIRPGRVTGLIGPNGAGKTTFIDAVTGFTRPSEGTLLLNGEEINDWSVVKRARRGVSRSFQSLELFEDSTVLDNLRVASDPRDFMSYIRDLVWPVTPPLPGHVVAAINEFGLEDDLDREVQELSYAKRRLLAIARAVAIGPSVLLLDEPAAGLGDVETGELATLVRRLADDWGMSVLLIEHDMNFVMSVCDDIVVLDFGQKISEGTPDIVRNDPAVVAAYLGETEEEMEAELHAAHEPKQDGPAPDDTSVATKEV